MTELSDQSLLWAFDGPQPPAQLVDRVRAGRVTGISLFRNHNIEGKQQVADLIAEIGGPVTGRRPLVAIDQEGGQLLGLAESVPFAGNLALGAVDDPDLTERVGQAVATELRSVGISVNYAPAADIMSQPDNPSLGIRSFGADPDLVARHVGAFTRGLLAGGVLPVTKHFPGEGEAAVDPHDELPVLDVDQKQLEQRELKPFQAAIEAGVAGVMVGHQALPHLTGRSDLPASVSSQIVTGLLRRHLGFEGIVISDALDMAALTQGSGSAIEVIAAIRAGVDLLLAGPDHERSLALATALDLAHRRAIIPDKTLAATAGRLARAHKLLATTAGPAGETEWDDEYRSQAFSLADELARRSITAVRDNQSLLPIPPHSRVAVVMPKPTDLTPADTSSWEVPGLAAALEPHVYVVGSVVVDHEPARADIDRAVTMAREATVAVVGTIAANDAQAAMVRAVAETIPTVVCALRTPFDLAKFPELGTYLCTYSLLEPSLDALAAVLAGKSDAEGRLPCAIGDLYPAGHGLARPRSARELR